MGLVLSSLLQNYYKTMWFIAGATTGYMVHWHGLSPKNMRRITMLNYCICLGSFTTQSMYYTYFDHKSPDLMSKSIPWAIGYQTTSHVIPYYYNKFIKK